MASTCSETSSSLTAGSSSEQSMQAGNQVQSDPDGRFRLEHVPMGTVFVRAYDGGHAVTTVSVEVKQCAAQPSLKVNSIP